MSNKKKVKRPPSQWASNNTTTNSKETVTATVKEIQTQQNPKRGFTTIPIKNIYFCILMENQQT